MIAVKLAVSAKSDLSLELFQHDCLDLYPSSYKAAQAARQPAIKANVRMVPLQAQASSSARTAKDATFGQRLSSSAKRRDGQESGRQHVVRKSDGTVEMSWVPSSGGGKGKRRSSGFDDMDVDTEGSGRGRGKGKEKDTRKGVERFGAGMEKGGEAPADGKMSEAERRGRTHRRKDVRSGSKNTFRRI